VYISKYNIVGTKYCLLNSFGIAAAEINYSLERYGEDSLCFDHGSAWTVQHCDRIYPVEHWGSGCYQVLSL